MSEKHQKLISFLLLTSVLFVPVNLTSCRSSRKTSARLAVFDTYHREIFSFQSTSDMGYSDFSQSLSHAGYVIEAGTQPLTDDGLKNARLLVLAGPMTDFTEQELRSITNFVKGGGNLLILIHISQPVRTLAEEFDVQPSLSIVCDSKNPVDNSPQDFYLSDFATHPLTANIKKLAVFGTWGLRTRENGSADIIARTSTEAWVDLNKDQMLSQGEPQEPYGIVAISKYGDGKTVICADDAILINKFLKAGDNHRFEENLITWFENKAI